MKSGTIWVIVIIILLAALGWWWYSTQQQAPAATENTGVVAGEENFGADPKDGEEGVNSVTVNYTANGFSPKTLTVPFGTRVTFVNQGAGEMWVASDEHPTHTGYSGTNRKSHCPDPAGVAFDQCGTGASYSFVFLKAGTWSYHNHRNDDDRGTIVVTP